MLELSVTTDPFTYLFCLSENTLFKIEIAGDFFKYC